MSSFVGQTYTYAGVTWAYDPASAEYRQVPAAAAPQQVAPAAQPVQQQTQYQWTPQQWASMAPEQQQAWTVYYQQQSVLQQQQQQQQQQQAYLQQQRAPPPLHPPVAPPPAAAKAAPAATATVDEWPPSFKDFVVKCFQTCTNAANKALLAKHLKILTVQSKTNNSMWSTDWALQPAINAVDLEAAERAKTESFKAPPPPAAPAQPNSWLQAAKKGVSLRWGPEAGAPAPAPAIPPPPLGAGDISSRLQFKPSKKDREGSDLDAPLTKVSKRQQKAEVSKKGKKSFGADDEGFVKPWKRSTWGNDATSALLDDIAASFITEVVKGSCEALEKPYMRQQMQPLSSEVRPERVLLRSIALMKERHAKGASYDYISEQMKSIRQDLALQAIRNATTADASEFHSLVCLEHNDLAEFNKIQPFLRDLYKEGVPGRPELIGSLQLLYWLYYSNWTEVSKLLQSQLPYKDHPDMKHAIKVQAAINLGNWVRVLKLRSCATTKAGAALLDAIVADTRSNAFRLTLLKAYRPGISVDRAMSLLDLTDKKDWDAFAAKECIVLDPNGGVDAKETQQARLAKEAAVDESER